jgi:hypothetical protein
MLGLVRLVAVEPPPAKRLRRLWLIFFSNTADNHWWTRFLTPGFRHVTAAAWFATEERWVYFNPTARGTVIEIATDAEFGPRFQQLVQDSTAILLAPSQQQRRYAPAAFFCVGAIKALLGIRCCALGPLGLYRHLLANGAEPFTRLDEDRSGSQRADPASPAGRPGDQGRAGTHETARGGGQDPRDAGAAQARDAIA